LYGRWLFSTTCALFRFWGTQQHERQIAALSEHLPDDTVLYVHSEQVAFFCHSCWRSRDCNHTARDRQENRVVKGKLCAPPTLAARDLLTMLDRVVDESHGVRLLVPRLAEAAGDAERASVEKRRAAMVDGDDTGPA